MPVISKETLKAMKAFTDKLIEAGDINDGSVRGYFRRIRDDESFPENVRENAREIVSILDSNNYEGATLYQELLHAKELLDQMSADNNFPNGTPDAEEKCKTVMETFKKYYDTYKDLDYYVKEFNRQNNYVELGKRNSALRPLMPKINAFMYIETFYSLFTLQAKNGNIENKIDTLRKDDNELTALSGFMKFEKEIDPRAYEYKKLKTDYEEKNKILLATQKTLESYSSPEMRNNYLERENRHKTAQQLAVEDVAKKKKILDSDDAKVKEAALALEAAEEDYKKYENAKKNVGNLLNRASASKKAYESAMAKYVELEKDRSLLKNARMTFNMDPSNTKFNTTKVDESAIKYYHAKTAGSKWEIAGKLFEDFAKKYEDPKYQPGLIAFFADPDSPANKTYAKFYPKGTVIGDQIEEVKQALEAIKKAVPDPEFFDRMLELSGDKKNENGKFTGLFNMKALYENIKTGMKQEEEKAYKDLVLDNSYRNYEIKKAFERQIREITNTNQGTELLPEIKRSLNEHLQKMDEEGSVNLSQIDDIVALEAKIKEQELKGIEQAKFEAEKKFQQDSETAREALDNLIKIQKDQIIKNDKGIQLLQKNVEAGNLSIEDYNIIIADTFKTKEVSEYHKEIVRKCEQNLENAKANRDVSKNLYQEAKNDLGNEKFATDQASFYTYRQKAIAKAGELQEDKDELKKLEGKYLLYTDGLKLYENVENQRKDLRNDFESLIGKEDVLINIYRQIEAFQREFTYCRKHVHQDPTEGNSDAYNAIWTAMAAFGTKDEFMALSDAEVKQRLNALSTAAKNYKIAKDNQWYHIDFFSSDKRYYRLNFANAVSQFCDLENALIGEKGWELSEKNKNFIHAQNELLPKYEEAEEPLNKRFEHYVSHMESNESVKNQSNRLKEIEQTMKMILENEENYRKDGKFVVDTSDEQTKENYINSVWKTIYYIHALNELHAAKPGETMEQRMQRAENLLTYEEINIDALKEDKPENKMFRDVGKYYSEMKGLDLESSIKEWKKVSTASIRHTMDVHPVEIEKHKLGKILDERENARLQQLAARKNIINNNPNPANNPKEAGEDLKAGPKPTGLQRSGPK